MASDVGATLLVVRCVPLSSVLVKMGEKEKGQLKQWDSAANHKTWGSRGSTLFEIKIREYSCSRRLDAVT